MLCDLFVLTHSKEPRVCETLGTRCVLGPRFGEALNAAVAAAKVLDIMGRSH